MKINCVHGYITFEESRVGEISRFMSLFEGLEIVSIGDRFTFAFLKDAPIHSLKGAKILGATATATISAEPGEVFRANKLVYNFQTDLVQPIEMITQRVSIQRTANYFLSAGLILPGSLTDRGKRVTDYAAWYLFEEAQFKYSEVTLG